MTAPGPEVIERIRVRVDNLSNQTGALTGSEARELSEKCAVLDAWEALATRCAAAEARVALATELPNVQAVNDALTLMLSWRSAADAHWTSHDQSVFDRLTVLRDTLMQSADSQCAMYSQRYANANNHAAEIEVQSATLTRERDEARAQVAFMERWPGVVMHDGEHWVVHHSDGVPARKRGYCAAFSTFAEALAHAQEQYAALPTPTPQPEQE